MYVFARFERHDRLDELCLLIICVARSKTGGSKETPEVTFTAPFLCPYTRKSTTTPPAQLRIRRPPWRFFVLRFARVLCLVFFRRFALSRVLSCVVLFSCAVSYFFVWLFLLCVFSCAFLFMSCRRCTRRMPCTALRFSRRTDGTTCSRPRGPTSSSRGFSASEKQ